MFKNKYGCEINVWHALLALFYFGFFLGKKLGPALINQHNTTQAFYMLWSWYRWNKNIFIVVWPFFNSLAPRKFDNDYNFLFGNKHNSLIDATDWFLQYFPWYCSEMYATESQLWKSILVRKWLGAIRHQAITWAKIDPGLCRHMASQGRNELIQES